MKPEKSKPTVREIKSAKETESEADLTPLKGETFVEKEQRIDAEVIQLLASRDAYIESGLDETGSESVTVKRKIDDKIILYTIFPWEIDEIKKVIGLSKISK